MKFLPLVWRNLLRRKVRTSSRSAAIVRRLRAVRRADGDPRRLQHGRRRRRAADRLMMIHKISIIQPAAGAATRDRIGQIDGRAPTSRTRTGSAATTRTPNQLRPQHRGRSGELAARSIQEFELPADQKKAWLADRTGAIVGVDTAKNFGWKVGDRSRSRARSISARPTAARGSSPSTASTIRRCKGADKTQFFFHYDYPQRDDPRASGLRRSGRLVRLHGSPIRIGAEIVARRSTRMFANSPRDQDRRPRRRSCPTSAKQIGDIGSDHDRDRRAWSCSRSCSSPGNTMAQSVRERTNELARAEDARLQRRPVLALVLLESLHHRRSSAAGSGWLVAWTIITLGGDPTGGLLPIFYFPPRRSRRSASILVLVLGIGDRPPARRCRRAGCGSSTR